MVAGGKLKMKALAQFFKDDVGEFSSLRLLIFIITAVTLFNWTYGCIAEGRYVAPGMDLVGLIASLLGAKAAQSHVELNCTAAACPAGTGKEKSAGESAVNYSPAHVDEAGETPSRPQSKKEIL